LLRFQFTADNSDANHILLFKISPTATFSILDTSPLHFFNVVDMPFLIRPPQTSAEAEDPGCRYTLIEPDDSEWSMLRDMHKWGWIITRHDFGDDLFIDALKQIEEDIKRRRRHTHAIAGELIGYKARPTLEDLWYEEGEKMLNRQAYEEEKSAPGRQLAKEDESFTEKEHSREAETCVSRLKLLRLSWLRKTSR
jgi:hypothetical protein